MKKTFIGKFRGFSLVEMMVGITVGLIIASGAMTFYVNTVKSNADTLGLAVLNQNLRAIMDVMVRDIRRAGYVTSDPANQFSSITNNPFAEMYLLYSGTATSLPDGAEAACILYSYNRNWAAGAAIAVDTNEQFGFGLSAGNIKMKKSGASTTATDADCSNISNGTYWETLNDPNIQISALSFVRIESPLNITSMLDGTGDGDGDGKCDIGEACNVCTRDGAPDPACLYVRDITISITGNLVADPSVSQTITEQVRVRNDKYLPAI